MWRDQSTRTTNYSCYMQMAPASGCVCSLVVHDAGQHWIQPGPEEGKGIVASVVVAIIRLEALSVGVIDHIALCESGIKLSIWARWAFCNRISTSWWCVPIGSQNFEFFPTVSNQSFENNLSRFHCNCEPQIEDSDKFIEQVWPLENVIFTTKIKTKES